MNEQKPTLTGRALLAVLCGLALLAGCGGGGDGSAAVAPPAPAPPAPPPPTPTPLPASVRIDGPAQGEVGQPMVLASDLGDGLAGLAMAWDFGDGTGSALARPTHVFAQPGDHEVRLTVTNAAGQSIVARASVRIGRFAMVRGRVCSGVDGNGWCWQRPLPDGNVVHRVHFHDAVLGWAVGDAGQVLRTSDGGLQWQRIAQQSGSDATLVKFGFADAQHGYALTASQALLGSTDGGAAWTARPLRPPSGDAAIWGWTDLAVLGPQTVFVRATDPTSGMFTYGAQISTDGGQAWRDLPMRPGVALPSGRLWTFESPDRLLRSDDLGLTLVPGLSHPSPGPGLPQVLGPDVLLLRWNGSGGIDPERAQTTFWRSTDAGRSWQSEVPQVDGQSRPLAEFLSVAFSERGTGLGVLLDRGLVRTQDWGRTWRTVPLGSPFDLDDFALEGSRLIDADTVHHVHDGTSRLTVDGGRSWRALGHAAEGRRADSVERDNQGGLLLRFDSRLYRSTDGGATMQPVGGGRTADGDHAAIAGLWFFDARRGLAVTHCGQLLDTDDGGLSWRPRAGSVPCRSDSGGAFVSGLQFTPNGTGWRLARGELLKSTDGGRTWQAVAGPPGLTEMASLHFIDDRRAWLRTERWVVPPFSGGRVVCDDSALNTTEDGGATWVAQTMRFSRDCSHLHRPVDGLALAVDGGGSIWRSTDDGRSWTQASVQAPAPAWASRYGGPMHFIDSQRGWMIRQDEILRTVDGGQTWTAGARPALGRGGYLQTLRFADAQHGWVVGSGGLVFATTDGGVSWTRQAPPSAQHFGALFVRDRATVWIGGTNGSVLATASGGR